MHEQKKKELTKLKREKQDDEKLSMMTLAG